MPNSTHRLRALVRARANTLTLSTLRAALLAAVFAAVFVCDATSLSAQTDFMNTDRGRPLSIEDASVVERGALELQVAPLRLERSRGGLYLWGLEPGVMAGLFARTEFDVGLPIALRDLNGVRTLALAGIDVGVMHQLNAESTTLPAFALRLDATIPTGGFGPDRVMAALGTMLTRSFDDGVRLHANATVALGNTTSSPGASSARDYSRWMAGLSLDRTWALSSVLVGVEGLVREPVGQPGVREWSVGLGSRVQLDPRWLLDVGAGRHFGSGIETWYATIGGAYAFGWRFGMAGEDR